MSLLSLTSDSFHPTFGRQEFGQEADGDSDFMPHASLVYGDLPMPTREDIRKEAEPTLASTPLVLDTIEVWCTQGVVAEWKCVATHSLTR